MITKNSVLGLAFMVLTITSMAKPAIQTLNLPDNISTDKIVQASTKLLPHPRQLKWQEMEFYGFIHFGINTFTGVEWGSGKEDPAAFAPPSIDTDQWVRTAKSAGMKMMMITV